jgi:hypothetical protein
MTADGSNLLAATPAGVLHPHHHPSQRHSPASTVASVPSVGTQPTSAVSTQAEGWSTHHARGAYSPGATTPLEAPGSSVDVSAPEMQWNVPAAQAAPTAHHVAAGGQAAPMDNVDPAVANQMGYYVVGYHPSNQRTPPPPHSAAAPSASVAHTAHAVDYHAQQRHLSSQMSQPPASYSPFHEQNSYMSNESMQMMGRPQGQHLMYNLPNQMKQDQ